MNESHVICPRCGQLIEVSEDVGALDDNARALLALQHCDCTQAREDWQYHKRREKKLQDATTSIGDLFTEGSGNPIEPDSQDHAVKLLKAAVEAVVDGHLFGVSVSIPGGVRASVSRGSKDLIRVERSDTIKQKQEV